MNNKNNYEQKQRNRKYIYIKIIMYMHINTISEVKYLQKWHLF